MDGTLVGGCLGEPVGAIVGAADDTRVGGCIGEHVGSLDSALVGAIVGFGVGPTFEAIAGFAVVSTTVGGVVLAACSIVGSLLVVELP